MKYIDEYRDGGLARSIAATIAARRSPGRHYQFMEFCGGHTHAISRYGIEDLLPPTWRWCMARAVRSVYLPVGRIDDAIRLAMRPEVTLCTYADLMRVPASGGASLLKAKAAGADIRMVYSTLDAIRIAEAEPARQVVFFAIGFETTTPVHRARHPAGATEAAHELQRVLQPRPDPAGDPRRSSTPPTLPEVERVLVDGFVGPAHVSTVIGTSPMKVSPRNSASRSSSPGSSRSTWCRRS
jgi:hydrogenase expression/formation protein HypD